MVGLKVGLELPKPGRRVEVVWNEGEDPQASLVLWPWARE